MVRSRGAVAAVVLAAGVSLVGCAQQASPATTPDSAARATEPLRISLCDNPGELTAWMRADGLPVDQARCAAEPGEGRALRAFGKWAFPASRVESIEIAVFPDRGPDGGSAFDSLRGAYPPHEQVTVAGFYSKVANTRGRTLVHLPELAEPLDITITTVLTGASEADYAAVRAGHLRALEQLVPTLARP
ncbi:hypothetical protein [Saccharothrix obliqua]|uniref:hypothetical protein n=1 Tax=Saccharothrix obliqua TaxID=2861747 RepID=UPI001C5D9FC0|nr:hypothetical protein [Saccharothrix obliqua]MBW4716853.1 hypothetical protein [Saccharothrix obliqua]